MATAEHPLTTRRKLLLNGIVDGCSIAEASRRAMYATPQSGHEALTDMRPALCAVMDDVGLSEWELLARVRELTDAEKTTVVSRLEGIVRVDVPDNPTRIKAIEIAASLRGMLRRDDRPAIGTVNIYWAGNMPNWSAADNQSVIAAESVPNSNQAETDTPTRSTVVGPLPDPGLPTGTHCQSSSKQDVLTQRIRKKRKPRLPVYRGDE